MENNFRELLNMDNKEFKQILNCTACKEGFKAAFGGWFRESNDCIVTLDLQKSGYGNYYYVNIKIYIHGVFNSHYSICKEIVKNDLGAFSTRPPKLYENILNLDLQMEDDERKLQLQTLFSDFITPFTDKALTLNGIKELVDKGQLLLLPAVKKELGKLSF